LAQSSPVTLANHALAQSYLCGVGFLMVMLWASLASTVRVPLVRQAVCNKAKPFVNKLRFAAVVCARPARALYFQVVVFTALSDRDGIAAIPTETAQLEQPGESKTM
jgi:hypothetical protein